MGRKIDLSGLTDNEAEHVLQVVQRDMRLRKKEEERLSELKQELDEEGSRCLLLSRQSCFNRRCCIRCCSPFTFLLNPKRQCRDCHYNVCKACRVYCKRDKAWLCSACQKSRFLKTQSLEWFYTNVKKRFKRFGSAKVLKTLYRKHLVEHSALSELTEGSAYEESICNEGSVCGSDSAFYRQTEEHSMAETLTVAMRVAEEAIDEAISKAEFDTSSQEKQNEAHYLREHRAELIEELAKTIVQKIISRRKTLAEMKADYDQECPLEHNADLHLPPHHQATSDHLKHQQGLWRSHSAFSLLDNDPPDLTEDSAHALKKEGGGSAMSAWRSVDRLDSAVLKSPDGNWIALQSTQLSRPSLLTRRKSLVYSALEKESAVKSAYEGMGSDNETKAEPDSSWGAALQEIHRKMMDSNFNPQDSPDRTPSPLSTRRGSREDRCSDSEGNWRLHKPLLALLKRKVPAEMRRPSSSRRTSVIDVNFNVEGEREDEEEKEASAELDVDKVKRSRKKRRSKEESSPPSLPDHCREQENKDTCPQDASGAMTPDTLTSGATTPEPLEPQSYFIAPRASQDNEELTVNVEQLEDRESDAFGGEEVNDDGSDGPTEEEKRGSSEEEEERMEVDLDEGTKGEEEEEEEEEEEDEEEMKHRLYRLVAQSRLTYFSSTDDELDKVGHSDAELEGAEEEEEEEEEKTDRLTYKLCQLEKEVRATQFSSTEDELDRAGVMDGSMEEEEEEEEELAVKVCKLVHQVNATQFSSTEDELDKVGVLDEDQPAEKGEELAVKVCRLVSQVNAAQFSSTEDELDRVGRGEEEVMDEETLWKVQAEKAVQAAQLRDLSSLVGVSKFPSAEDQPDGGEDEGPGSESSTWEEVPRRVRERRESFGDLDVDMFDLQDEIETRQKEESQDEKVTTESVMDSETEDGQDGSVAEEKEDDSEETGGEGMAEKEDFLEAEKAKETEGRREVEAEEIIIFSQTKAQQENEPEAKRPEREEEEEELTESQESQEKWAPQADSQDEDDVEFNRIISSMLMMTLEDMQGEMLKNQEAENARKNAESVGTETESRQEENNGDSQSTSASERTGSANEFQSPSEKVMLVTDAPGEEVTELDGNVSNGGDSSGGGNELHELRNLANENPPEPPADQTTEAEQTSEGAEEEERGVLTEQQLTEPQGDAAEGDAEKVDNVEPWDAPHLQQGLMSPEQIHIRYSAASLRNITTEVLKVLNATEELLQGVEGGEDPPLPVSLLPPNTDPKKLDQQFSRLEENVYVAAGTVYSLEAELGDLEECARGISSATSDMELSYLEEQVASAAAKVQQSELQISDISARIAALKNAGLDVDSQSHMKTRTIPVRPVTLDSSRQLRRRLPAPPVKDQQS
ncbi:uncharacterized protein V6R79_010635 [Siganus canaliculatus]